MTKLPRLSVTIATKNEGANLLDCIASVVFADEILIVDDCSTDDTVEKARSSGARVIVRDSGGSFHENKNLAIKEAKGEWILSLDADEFVTGRLSRSIQSVLSNPKHNGYLVDRHNYFLGQWIRGCGWYPDYILRLFKKGKAWWPLEIHDTPKLQNGNKHAGVLEGPLIHYSYNSFDQYFVKFNRYTSRLAVEYDQNNFSIRGIQIPVNLFFRPFYWFLKKYVFMRGFKDGLPGFFISFSSALTIIVSYSKLWYAQKENAKRRAQDRQE
jgi:glycosyltransferase involved in cell wall biosynthesis